MGHVVIAVYRPKPGLEEPLCALVRSHVPKLRELGMVTQRAWQVLKAKDGTLLEIFEWKSEEAVQAAHHSPEVMAMWNQFGEFSDFSRICDVPESQQPFPHFEPLDFPGMAPEAPSEVVAPARRRVKKAKKAPAKLAAKSRPPTAASPKKKVRRGAPKARSKRKARR